MKQVFRELKKPEVQATFKAVIVDTIDVAADRCKKYICQQNDIEELGDLGYGKGWTKFKDEFNEVFRGLTQLGYAVFFIGHHKEATTTDPVTGVDRMIIRPSLSASTREVIAGMADIYGYAHQKKVDEMSVLTLRSTDGSIECGCRFKYIPQEITMSYSNLIDAIQSAIDQEAAEHGGRFVTDERVETPIIKTYDYDALMAEFKNLVDKLMVDNQSNAPKITAIVEKYLGKGKKASDATPEQAEFLYLIVTEIKEDLIG